MILSRKQFKFIIIERKKLQYNNFSFYQAYMFLDYSPYVLSKYTNAINL